MLSSMLYWIGIFISVLSFLVGMKTGFEISQNYWVQGELSFAFWWIPATICVTMSGLFVFVPQIQKWVILSLLAVLSVGVLYSFYILVIVLTKCLGCLVVKHLWGVACVFGFMLMMPELIRKETEEKNASATQNEEQRKR